MIKALYVLNLHRKAVDYITSTEKEPLVVRPGAPFRFVIFQLVTGPVGGVQGWDGS